MFSHRERYFRSVLDSKPVVACGQPVAQAAARISDEHDFVLTTHARDGHRSRSKASVIAASCVKLELQASERLHASSVQPAPDAGERRSVAVCARRGPGVWWFVAQSGNPQWAVYRSCCSRDVGTEKESGARTAKEC